MTTPSDNPDPLTPQRRASVAAIVRCTREMLSAAREGEWDRMIEQEQARRPLIEAFFATPPERYETPAVAEFIREVQASDAEVITLAEQGKQAAADVLRLLTNRNRAADAYATAARRR